MAEGSRGFAATDGPAIGALAPWFGGKRTMAPAIVEALGPHSAYWEPFCGSMAVLMAKPASQAEAVNDLNADLVNLARVVMDPKLGPALYRRLRRTLFAQDLFAESRREVLDGPAPADDGPDPGRAYAYFVASWMGMNGVAGTAPANTGFCRRFNTTGGAPGTRFVGAVRSIPAWRRRLERVQVLRCDAFDLIPRIEDRPGVSVYCDPPYLVKGAKYVHDFDAADHGRLAESLARFRSTRVVVSYYEHPKLADLYPRWHRRSVSVAKGIVNAGKREAGRVEAPEVLLSNLPFPASAGGQGELFG